MAITVRIPSPLQKLTKNEEVVEANGANIKELIDDLEKNYPGIKARICDEKGNVRKFINIYVNEEDVRFLQRDKTPVKAGDEVSIVPAIAGGGQRAEERRKGPADRRQGPLDRRQRAENRGDGAVKRRHGPKDRRQGPRDRRGTG